MSNFTVFPYAHDKINANIGTAPTNNKEFDKNGYFIVRNIVNVNNLVDDVPKERNAKIAYFGSEDKFSICNAEQVQGAVARYNHPKYKSTHHQVLEKISAIIGKPLYKTYYYDRFYFPGQELHRHTDRDSCEISITIHIGTNLKEPWGFWILTPSNQQKEIILNPGDGVIYKGCEQLHWRKPMPGVRRNKLRKMFKQPELYYHQIFFHYVLANGYRVHCANDPGVTS